MTYYAYIPNVTDGTVSVIDTAINTVIANATISTSVSNGLAVSPDNKTAYVTYGGASGKVATIDITVSSPIVKTGTGYPLACWKQSDWHSGHPRWKKGIRGECRFRIGGTVDVIDLTVSPPVVKTGAGYPVTVGNYPTGIAITPNSAHVYVTNSNSDSISVIDTSTDTVSTTISLPATSEPFGVAVTPDGNHVYVTDENTGKVSVIATTTNTVSATITLTGTGGVPRGIAITPDGTKAYVGDARSTSTTVWVINTSTNTVSTTVSAGSQPTGISITPDGKYAYVTNVSSNSVSGNRHLN